MEILFIQGPEKTATSTMTGILNCHPNIFILFENYLAQSKITKYGNKLFERYPEARQFFREEEDHGKPVTDFFEYLKRSEPEYSFDLVGTKINSLDPFLTQKVKNHKVIFMFRDIRSWLVKESVIKYYRTDLDVVMPTKAYLRYVIKTAFYEHALRIRTEDLILSNEKILTVLSKYLKMDLKPHVDKWWKKIGKRELENPKSVFNKIGKVHPSSLKKPKKLDTVVELSSHPFWENVCHIFDNYSNTSEEFHFAESQLLTDLALLDELDKYAPLPFTECYKNVESKRFGFSNSRTLRHPKQNINNKISKSLVSKLFEKIKSIKKTVKRQFSE